MNSTIPRAEGTGEMTRLRTTLKAITPLFLLTVAIPTLLACLYYGIFASDVYVSETRFVIRTPERQATTGGLGALLQNAGFTRAQDDAFTVQDYVRSRDALRALDEKMGLAKIYGSTQVDLLARFAADGDDSFEALHKYYRTKVIRVEHDAASSITTMQVRAPSAQQALAFNKQLLEMGEQLVNRLNERARQDLIRFAGTEVAEAERKAKAAALQLSAYRTDKQVIDPERQAALQLQQVMRWQEELLAARTQLAQYRSFTPENPQIPALKQRVSLLEQEIEADSRRVVGGGDSLARKAADYQRLQLESQFADRHLGSLMASLESARSQAQRQQLYLERIVQPNEPDIAVEPRRLRNVVAVLLIGLIVWGVLAMLLAGAREHRD